MPTRPGVFPGMDGTDGLGRAPARRPAGRLRHLRNGGPHLAAGWTTACTEQARWTVKRQAMTGMPPCPGPPCTWAPPAASRGLAVMRARAGQHRAHLPEIYAVRWRSWYEGADPRRAALLPRASAEAEGGSWPSRLPTSSAATPASASAWSTSGLLRPNMPVLVNGRAKSDARPRAAAAGFRRGGAGAQRRLRRQGRRAAPSRTAPQPRLPCSRTRSSTVIDQ